MRDRRETLWWGAVLVVAMAACGLRVVFPLADPPWLESIGITWHDEGVWAHNARNKALFGDWRTDEWNPMYVSPVFTAVEYASFATFGVGLWQARLVSMLAGVLSVIALALGLRAFASRRAAVAGAALLAVNYTWVMYNRVALLEALMVSLIVVAWACYAHAGRNRALAVGAAVLALGAFFTKASAAFFLVALGIDSLVRVTESVLAARAANAPIGRAFRSGPGLTLASLAVGTVVSLAVFVVPNWAEYSFYNLYVYGSRRAATGAGALVDRASWLPVIHGFFSRQWVLTLSTLIGLVPLVVQVRRIGPGARLLALWLLLGVFELVLHDLGNERRYVFLIPAMTGIAAYVLAAPAPFPDALRSWSRRQLIVAGPLALAGLYVAFGSLTRELFMPDISLSVRTGAALAVCAAAVVWLGWPKLRGSLVACRVPRVVLPIALAVIASFDLAAFYTWAEARTYKNVDASRLVAERLPAGTIVQGKLANGLALENGIRPLFIGPGFGNYADRHDRDDVGWILTYSQPRLGYEGAVIREVLDALPDWEVVAEFPVAETPSGTDRAVLVRKRQ